MADKFQQVVSDAVYSVCILGNLETRDVVLLDMPLLAKDAAAALNMAMRGKFFLGVVGIVAGHPRAVFSDLLPREMYEAVAKEFCQRITTAFREIERMSRLPAN
jgi:hypothetical protein